MVTGVVEKVTNSQITITRDEGFSGSSSRISHVKRGTSVLVLGTPEEQELAKAYAETVDNLKQVLKEDWEIKVAQLEEQYKDHKTNLDSAYTAFLEDLKGAWDVDEMKMLVEHHFGDVVE